jgi:hypothetical protein
MDRIFISKSITIFVAIGILCFLSTNAHAQIEKTDKIYKKDSTVMSVKIVNDVNDTIFYQAYWKNNSPIFGLSKTDIDKIVFKSGVSSYAQQVKNERKASINKKKKTFRAFGIIAIFLFILGLSVTKNTD